MRRLIADPFKILLAIDLIGKNGPISKKDVLIYLNDFSKKELDSKSKMGSANDVLFNLKELRLAQTDNDNLVLTMSGEKSHVRLYSGKEVYHSYKKGDNNAAMKMLQTNALHYSPEIREVIAFIFHKRGPTRAEIGVEFVKKTVYGHTFNQFTIDTTIAELERMKLIQKKRDGTYSVQHIHDLVFAQILTEEVLRGSNGDKTVSEHQIKDIFDLKYGITFPEFDELFSRLRRTQIPDLIIPGSYGKFSIALDIAKEVRLL